MFDGTLGTKMRSECTFLIASTDALFEKKTHQYLRLNSKIAIFHQCTSLKNEHLR